MKKIRKTGIYEFCDNKLSCLHDDLPEEAFRLVGTIDDAVNKARGLQK